VVVACFASAVSAGDGRRKLRVCADGNSLPFSNERGEGFENKLASLVARDLHARVEYTFAPQRRGFVRNTLKAKRCDVIMGVPTALDMVATTAPYYRSSYVFVFAPGTPRVTSLDSEVLRGLRIGVPLVGDDGANPPPVFALSQRGLTDNLRGYSVYGDYSKESPPADLLRGLRNGEIDVAIAWGPLAGYWAARQAPVLQVTPLPEAEAPRGASFAFDVSMGVRRGDRELLHELDVFIGRRKKEINSLLDAYHVPRSP
jgi:mxaJ protein